MPASPCPFLEFYCVGCDVLPSPVRRCLHCLHASASKSGQLNCATCGRTVQHQDPKTSAARQQGRTTNARHANTSRSCHECEREKDSDAHGSSQIANMTTGSADTHHAVAAVLLVVVETFSRAERLVRCDDTRLFSSAGAIAREAHTARIPEPARGCLPACRSRGTPHSHLIPSCRLSVARGARGWVLHG